jgi:hypothetical protein
VFFSAASLQTDLTSCHRHVPDGQKNRGASPLLVVKNRFPEYLADTKICNNSPSCRVGEASRARQKGSLASPTSAPRKGTREFLFFVCATIGAMLIIWAFWQGVRFLFPQYIKGPLTWYWQLLSGSLESNVEYFLGTAADERFKSIASLEIAPQKMLARTLTLISIILLYIIRLLFVTVNQLRKRSSSLSA